MSDYSERRLVIACGGTGGHLFPGIAVAESWTKGGGEVVLLISEKEIDALAAEGYGHLRFEKMASIAMPKPLSPRMIPFLGRFAGSWFSCRRLLKSFRAEAVLGMGGFTSAAPLLAGKWRGLPTFIHESNAIPGRSNKLNAKFARTVLVGFEECASHFETGHPVEVVGTPVRPSVANRPSRDEAAKFFGVSPEKKTIMVMGGSQGARRLNELVAAGLSVIEKAGMQVVHISGPADYDTVSPAYQKHPGAGVVKDFCAEIQYAYAAADLAICRSGASTLTELALYELPSILIPYPFAADDHQTRNAEIFSVPGAAVLWKQEELHEGNFSRRIVELLSDDNRIASMNGAMEKLAIPDASAQVCEVIVNQIREGN